MSLKIAMVAPMAGNPASKKGRQVVENIFVRNANKLKEEGTSVDYHLLEKGLTNSDHLCSEALLVWNDFEVFQAVRGLKDQGYDAVVIHCYSDPHLFASRQILDIPVVGVAQTSMMFASMMGPQFGVITFCQPYIGIIDRLIEKYGYKNFAVRTRSMDTGPEEFIQAYEDAHGLIEKFKGFARQCIEDGAEVLVPG
ncbi:MAG: aspartate/glutamate racemase family protein [Pseudomonadota bacterium]